MMTVDFPCPHCKGSKTVWIPSRDDEQFCKADCSACRGQGSMVANIQEVYSVPTHVPLSKDLELPVNTEPDYYTDEERELLKRLEEFKKNSKRMNKYPSNVEVFRILKWMGYRKIMPEGST